ncbi:MAG: sulfotransferase [Nocardioides sp.]|uniref:sulfotransferase family protein n=1 Tax=Nocardioides sp. TaxID=35761 RepID=UPI0039E6B550
MLGVARSGTTALADLLNAHPEVALGMERFKRLLQRDRIEQLTPALLEHDRFFDFSDKLTNLTPQHAGWAGALYAQLEAKWDTARYVGDKLTAVPVEALRRQHPDARFVVIVRDILEVAASWDKRATSADDPWKAGRDAAMAIRRWNEQSTQTLAAARAWPEQVTIVEYSRLFGDPDAAAFRALLDRLGLSFEPAADAFTAAHTTYVDGVRDKERSVDPDVLAQADEAVWKELVALSV